MKATINNSANGKSSYEYNKKELIKAYIGLSGKQEIFRINLYMGRSSRSSTVYCNVFIHNPNLSITGHGNAGGYGYDKQSAAVSEALQNAGIELDKNIAGVGPSAIREAMTAIMEALGFNDSFIVEA